MSPDQIPGTIADPQSLNKYSYVSNNPLNSIDPFGLARVFVQGDEANCRAEFSECKRVLVISDSGASRTLSVGLRSGVFAGFGEPGVFNEFVEEIARGEAGGAELSSSAFAALRPQASLEITSALSGAFPEPGLENLGLGPLAFFLPATRLSTAASTVNFADKIGRISIKREHVFVPKHKLDLFGDLKTQESVIIKAVKKFAPKEAKDVKALPGTISRFGQAEQIGNKNCSRDFSDQIL